MMQRIFLRAGVLIYMSNLLDGWADTLKQSHMVFVDRSSTGSPAEFDANIGVVVPVGANVKAAADALTKLKSQIKTQFLALMQKHVAVELGLASGASVADVGAALGEAMAEASALVATEGEFAKYFLATMSVTLPSTTGTPDLPESWVSGDPTELD
jgi:hypothetical protein